MSNSLGKFPEHELFPEPFPVGLQVPPNGIHLRDPPTGNHVPWITLLRLCQCELEGYVGANVTQSPQPVRTSTFWV